MIRSFTLATLILLVTASPALASPNLRTEDISGDEQDAGDYTFDVVDEEPGTGGAVTVEDGEDPEKPYGIYPFPVLDTDPNTREPCTRTMYTVAWTESQAQLASISARDAADIYYFTIDDPLDPPPPCSTVTVDEGEVAREAIDSVSGRVQPAEPSVQPDNRAITGIRSHLDTGIDTATTEIVTVTLFGRSWDVRVDIVGTHTIDWGDGTVDSGVTGDGGPWHDGDLRDGDITHHYGVAGEYDLVVRTDWTVTATIVATGTTATQPLTTTSAPVTIDVDEVRSVRDR